MEWKCINICVAQEEDARALRGIYAPYVEKTAITFEYDVPDEAEFARRIKETKKRYPFLLAECDGEVLGYAYAGAFKERAAYDWSVETSIYVKPNLKRQGLGIRLYHALEAVLKEQNILNVNACIACPEEEDEYLNRDSIRFHEKLGYRLVGKFHKCGYKFGRWYDMMWMEKHIGDHQAHQPAIKKFPAIEEKVQKICKGESETYRTK